MPKGIWRHRSTRIDRDEYLSRAYEFAHRTPIKLDADKVRSIRIRAAMGVSKRLMADQYRVSQNTITRVVQYESWL